jgi:branched-chain amino acid transport system substrate-binding protein
VRTHGRHRSDDGCAGRRVAARRGFCHDAATSVEPKGVPIGHQRFAPSALVRIDGRVEEVDGGAGRRLLEARPELCRYAAALLQSDRPRASFFWADRDSTWIRVTIDRSSSDDEAALITLSTECLPYGLTRRELDVLTLLATGLSNRHISDRLDAGVRTIATHVEHLLAKLDQRTRAGAGAGAVDQGLLRLPIPGGHGDAEALTIGVISRLAEAPTVTSLRRGPSDLGLGHARRPLLIGSVLALTGPARADGIEMRNGAALAIHEINARGGVSGRRIEHIVAPVDIFDERAVREGFDSLMTAEVDAITSLYVFCEDVAMERAAAYGAPFLHAMTSEHMAQSTRDDPQRYGGVFQVCASEVHYGRGFVRFLDGILASGAWRPHDRSLLFVETMLESSQIATSGTIDVAERSGWRVAGVQYVEAQGADWTAVVDMIHRSDPAAVVVTDFLPRELAGFQRAFAAAPTDVLLYAIYSPSVPEFLAIAGDAAEGLVWSTVTGTYGDGVGQRFMDRYSQLHGQPPGRSHAGIAYDEVHLIAQAWAAADNPRDFRAVAERLRRIRYRGVNGSYFFDNDRQSALAYPDMTRDPSLSQAHLVFQVQNGQHRVVSPAPYVEATFRTPPWCGSVRATA